MQLRFQNKARVFSIGRSIEGRDLNIIHISQDISTTINKQNIFIVGCHHAREWISVEIPLLFAKYLLENQDISAVKKALEANIYILPILNPDGLEFSIHNYRYWRKNRKYTGDFIWGIDLNRNYGYMWGFDNDGSSPSPESETYRGWAPFSEPETEALRQFLLANPPDGSISFHNYSQLILIPWGYTYEKPEDFEEMETIASKMSEKIFNVNGRYYDFGGADALYLVNGGSDDWIYGTFKTPSFTIELPPTNAMEGGFYTSEEEISLSFNENLPALLYFINYFVEKNKNEKENIIIKNDILNKDIISKIIK